MHPANRNSFFTLSSFLFSSFTLSTLTVSSFIFPCPLSADEGDPATSIFDDLEIHGHLSWAYAEASSTTFDGQVPSDQILGLSEDGSFDYRNAALQFRYRASERHLFVLQLSHQKLADSVLETVGNEIEVDWLYWDWSLGTDTRLRVGRLPTPAGIFNEVRDVGTVLPFFRPAFNFYREGSLFSETVDGVGLSHRLFAESQWPLQVDIYGGEFEVFEQGTGLDDEFSEIEADDAVGLQFWLDTPISGVRLGLGALRWDVSEESQFNPVETTWESAYASVEADFDRWVLRAEYRILELPFETTFAVGGDARVEATYWQVGWRPTERLSIYLQYELTDVRQESDLYLDGSYESDDRDDIGIAINYALRPNFVLKAEYHEQDFELTVSRPLFTEDGLRIGFDLLESGNEYVILGFATSF